MSKQTIDLTNRPLMIEPIRLPALMAAAGPNGVLSLFFNDDEEERPYKMDGNIAIFDIEGALYNEEFRFITNNGYKSFQKILKKSLEDSAVEGVLLNINSPGGEASGLFDLSDAIYNMRGTKPIWSIANDDMFSAAYGIGSATDNIYITRTGGVGSVGVIAVHLEISKAADKAGFTFTVFRAGKYKAESNPIEPLSPHANKSIQTEIDRLYGMFTELVARNRGMSVEKVRDTEAQLYFAEKGIEVGFADRLGTYDRVIAELKQFTSQKKGKFTMSNPGTNNQAGAAPNGVAASNEAAQTTPIAQETQPESTTQQPAASAPAKKPTITVVEFDDVQKTADENAKANVKQIAELCQIAGKPEMACGFIEQGLSVDDVRKKLIDMRAETADDNHLDGHHEPPAGSAQSVKIDANAIYAKANEHLRKR